MNEFYGTLNEANSYFENRLHETEWSASNSATRTKALIAATAIVDALNFKGLRSTVHTLLLSNPDATQSEIRESEQDQSLEFPRGADTVVPEAIKVSVYEIAYSLLDGRDPELELEALGISSSGYASVRTTYARNQVPVEHIINGVPSAKAWRLLRPFLRDGSAIQLSRVS